MTVDLLMGLMSLALGAVLTAQNGHLAAQMKAGDDDLRGHPWLRVFEPTDGPLATEAGRITAFRAWILASAAGFVVVGSGLLLRFALAV